MVSYDNIRHFGASIPLVAEHLLDTLADLVSLVPPARNRPLLDQARAVLHAGREEITNPRDLEAIERPRSACRPRAAPGATRSTSRRSRSPERRSRDARPQAFFQ